MTTIEAKKFEVKSGNPRAGFYFRLFLDGKKWGGPHGPYETEEGCEESAASFVRRCQIYTGTRS